MKLLAGSIVLLFASTWAGGSRTAISEPAASSPSGSTRVPVIVELFTSEGCSSCPPADSLLSVLDTEQPLGSAEVIPLEEHVTYWDQQGWKDPYDSQDWTDRQSDYTSALHLGTPYTPEMVVDGKVGFIGSRGSLASEAIQKAAAASETKVEISEISPAGGKTAGFKVNVEKLTGTNPKDKAEVLLAITESGLHSAVKAGENAGQELHHSPVLREMKVIGVAGKNGQETFSAQPSVKLDSHWKVENLRAVAFVQERKSRRILGAAEIHLTP